MSNKGIYPATMAKRNTEYVNEEFSQAEEVLLTAAMCHIVEAEKEGRYITTLYYFTEKAVELVAGALIVQGYSVELKSSCGKDQYELLVSWADPVEV